MTHAEESTATLAVWEDWRRCKQRSDQSMSVADCRDTAHAWVRFQNLYLGHSTKLATLPSQLRDLNSGGRP